MLELHIIGPVMPVKTEHIQQPVADDLHHYDKGGQCCQANAYREYERAQKNQGRREML